MLREFIRSCYRGEVVCINFSRRSTSQDAAVVKKGKLKDRLVSPRVHHTLDDLICEHGEFSRTDAKANSDGEVSLSAHIKVHVPMQSR